MYRNTGTDLGFFLFVILISVFTGLLTYTLLSAMEPDGDVNLPATVLVEHWEDRAEVEALLAEQVSGGG